MKEPNPSVDPRSDSGSPDLNSGDKLVEPEPAPDFRRGYFVRFPDGSLVKIGPPAPEWVRITVAA